MTAEARTSAPVPPGERLLSLDVIRGFAIFGVLLAYINWSMGRLPAEQWSSLDSNLELFFEFTVDSKFYSILSFLFGLGFFMIMERAEKRGAKVTAIYFRRLGVLAIFGLLHGLLLRDGDILLPYAVTGLLLLPFRKASDAVILATVFALVFYPAVVREAWQLTGVPMPQRPQTDGLGLLAHNFEWLKYYLWQAPYWPGNLATFLVGLYAGRHRILQRSADRPRALWAVMLSALVAGPALYGVREWLLQGVTPATVTDSQRLGAGLVFQAHAWLTATGYVAAILLLLRSERCRRLARPLAMAGRMTLTNYVMQAALVVPLCSVLGLYDHFTPLGALLLALALFGLVQVPLSLWWLRDHKFGPLEWLWRRLTYGKVIDQRHAEPVRPRSRSMPA